MNIIEKILLKMFPSLGIPPKQYCDGKRHYFEKSGKYRRCGKGCSVYRKQRLKDC
jgi:hypothetical protein